MQFVSTAGGAQAENLSDAMLTGAAPDGGLFMPTPLPRFEISDFDGCDTLTETAERLLTPFFAGDPLERDLGAIVRAAFDFPVPLREPGEGAGPGRDHLWMLELIHGPTAAFKDFGARFLAECLDRLGDPERPFLVLVATSGDTGGAVGQAFQNARTARGAILFPKGRVSPLQKTQLTCWGDKVASFEVDGDFDACQALVKAAFRDPELNKAFRLTSANSINLGRLLPQMGYYAWSSLQVFRKTGAPANYVIPSANMGNGMACILARAMGLPIGRIVLAVNANRTLADYFDTGKYEARPSIATIANAMDVGDPSNFARFASLLEAEGQSASEGITALSVDDDTIRARIRTEAGEHDLVLCPHTAVAAEAWDRLPDADKALHWVMVGTAHAAKFAEVVEPEIGRKVDLPPTLARLMDAETRVTPLEPDLHALRAGLLAAFG